jgi:hypothetical protein
VSTPPTGRSRSPRPSHHDHPQRST